MWFWVRMRAELQNSRRRPLPGLGILERRRGDPCQDHHATESDAPIYRGSRPAHYAGSATAIKHPSGEGRGADL